MTRRETEIEDIVRSLYRVARDLESFGQGGWNAQVTRDYCSRWSEEIRRLTGKLDRINQNKEAYGKAKA